MYVIRCTVRWTVRCTINIKPHLFLLEFKGFSENGHRSHSVLPNDEYTYANVLKKGHEQFRCTGHWPMMTTIINSNDDRPTDWLTDDVLYYSQINCTLMKWNTCTIAYKVTLIKVRVNHVELYGEVQVINISWSQTKVATISHHQLPLNCSRFMRIHYADMRMSLTKVYVRILFTNVNTEVDLVWLWCD